MRAIPLVASLCAAFLPPLGGAELHFRDGRFWPAARLLDRDTTYALVLHEKGIYTVHAEELTQETAAHLGIRPPTPEELAARAEAEARALEARRTARDEAARARQAGAQPAPAPERGKTPAKPETPRVVKEFSSVVAPAQSHPEVRLSGRVLARLARGAIVQAEGMPAKHPFDDVGWVVGTIYLEEDTRLNATFRGANLSGRVLPSGEHRYVDSSGTEHVLSAWRLE